MSEEKTTDQQRYEAADIVTAVAVELNEAIGEAIALGLQISVKIHIDKLSVPSVEVTVSWMEGHS